MGYEATSLRQIAAGSQIDIATLKYHFADKQTLFGEVYREGHVKFLAALEPVLDQIDDVKNEADVAALVDELVTTAHTFIEENLWFVRMTLYRVLEDSEDIIAIEDELQSIAISHIAKKFDKLIERKVVRPFDTRAFVVFLIGSFSIWQVSGRVRPEWPGPPKLDTKNGRARSESFFIEVLERFLL